MPDIRKRTADQIGDLVMTILELQTENEQINLSLGEALARVAELEGRLLLLGAVTADGEASRDNPLPPLK